MAAGSLTFVGNATTLLRLGSFTLLTDPNFIRRGQRAYLGKGLWTRRLTDPALRIDELPDLDAVVPSHLHGDHFDRVAKKRLDRSAPVLTTPPAARRLRRSDFTTVGLETWQRHVLRRPGPAGEEELSVESLPGVHAYGVMGRLLPPVMGSLIEHRVGGDVRFRLLISGDTLLGDHVEEIRARHPAVDLAVVHLGGTRVLMHTVTMDGEQGARYVRTLAPGRAVPVHYDDYGVFTSPLQDFLAAADGAGLAGCVLPVARGRTVELDPSPR